MAPMITDQPDRRHLLSSETRPRMVKVDLRKAEMDGWRERIGHAIEHVRELCGLSVKEFADAVARDERQVARWFNGKEHPQLSAIFAVAQMRQPLIIVLAELAGEGVEIETVVRVRSLRKIA